MAYRIRVLLFVQLLFLPLTGAATALRLKYPPTPPFAARHAEVAIDAVKRVDGITLDYTPASLRELDTIILSFREQGLDDDRIGETIFAFGCYAGEVFVRNRRAVWVSPGDVMPADVARNFPFMVVKLPGGQVWSPITRAFGELHNGREDSLEYLYRSAAAGD